MDPFRRSRRVDSDIQVRGGGRSESAYERSSPHGYVGVAARNALVEGLGPFT